MVYSKNKKAYHDYTIVSTMEAGISLLGSEVKSVRNSTVQLKGSYVTIKNGEVFLIGSNIAKPENIYNAKTFDEYRERKLLITKKEILKLHSKVKEKGFSLIALSIYQPEKTKKIKVELALVQGKRDYDKREASKRKTQEMDAKQALNDY